MVWTLQVIYTVYMLYLIIDTHYNYIHDFIKDNWSYNRQWYYRKQKEALVIKFINLITEKYAPIITLMSRCIYFQ